MSCIETERSNEIYGADCWICYFYLPLLYHKREQRSKLFLWEFHNIFWPKNEEKKTMNDYDPAVAEWCSVSVYSKTE